MIKIATVCSGIGSPEVAINELGIDHEITFACDIDKYARASYLANFKPKQMFTDMTKETWIGDNYYSDLFIGGIPCQAFSLAGKRLGELDKRGLLFYDYYRYVKEQQPKVFIIENVKGLLSDAGGKTFQNWLLLLGDSVNGHHQMFNHPDSLGYNLHWTVLNSKDFEVPQNRERVFIVGVRNDLPNNFRFPAATRLMLRLRDILEPVVDEKYYLSEAMINHFNTKKGSFEGLFHPKTGNDISSCIPAVYAKMPITNIIEDNVLVSKERRTPEAKAERRATGSNAFMGKEITFEPTDVMNCLQTGLTNDHLLALPAIFENADINQDQKTIKEADLYENKADAGRVYNIEGLARTLKANGGGLGAKTSLFLVPDDVNNKDGLTQFGNSQDHKLSPLNGLSQTLSAGHFNQPKILLDTACNQDDILKYRIRRLTPLECWRLQGFPDGCFYNAKFEAIVRAVDSIAANKNFKKLDVDKAVKGMSDSQLYKQAGNSMTSKVMKAIIKNTLPILQHIK